MNIAPVINHTIRIMRDSAIWFRDVSLEKCSASMLSCATTSTGYSLSIAAPHSKSAAPGPNKRYGNRNPSSHQALNTTATTKLESDASVVRRVDNGDETDTERRDRGTAPRACSTVFVTRRKGGNPARGFQV